MGDLIGQILLSQFRVDTFVAAGGMGAVYRVWDIKRNVPLAMKVLHSELAEDPSMFKHFQREARALQKLAHPNIVPFYGLYQTADFAFMLERYVDGPSLKDILKLHKGKSLPMQEALIYLKALCAGLGYAHANHVVHCDVKPGNVMIDSGGNIYLTDFGIARHAESSTTTMGVAGTSAYMPPEQILGQPVTAATDVYALGVILYEMLTGRRPFRGGGTPTDQSTPTLNMRIRQEQLHIEAQDPRELVPSIPVELAQVILTALNKKHAKRFADAPRFFEAVCKAAGVNPNSIGERTSRTEASNPKNYASGHEVIKGESQQPRPSTGRSLALVGGIIAAGIFGCVVLVLIGILTFGNFGGPSTVLTGLGEEPTEENSASQSADVSPFASSTPDPNVAILAVEQTQVALVPQATNTAVKPKCPGNLIKSINEVFENDVMLLQVCANDRIYEYGNLAYGISRIGPNNKFFVYITFYGNIYVARVGDKTLTPLAKIEFFNVINVDDVPQLEVTFYGDHPYKVKVKEIRLNQSETFDIPRRITSPGD